MKTQDRKPLIFTNDKGLSKCSGKTNEKSPKQLVAKRFKLHNQVQNYLFTVIFGWRLCLVDIQPAKWELYVKNSGKETGPKRTLKFRGERPHFALTNLHLLSAMWTQVVLLMVLAVSLLNLWNRNHSKPLHIIHMINILMDPTMLLLFDLAQYIHTESVALSICISGVGPKDDL